MKPTHCYHYLSIIKEKMTVVCGSIMSNARGMEMTFQGEDGQNYIIEVRPVLPARLDDINNETIS